MNAEKIPAIALCCECDKYVWTTEPLPEVCPECSVDGSPLCAWEPDSAADVRYALRELKCVHLALSDAVNGEYLHWRSSECPQCSDIALDIALAKSFDCGAQALEQAQATLRGLNALAFDWRRRTHKNSLAAAVASDCANELVEAAKSVHYTPDAERVLENVAHAVTQWRMCDSDGHSSERRFGDAWDALEKVHGLVVAHRKKG